MRPACSLRIRRKERIASSTVSKDGVFTTVRLAVLMRVISVRTVLFMPIQ